jgi:hypothetical protein
MTQEELIKEIRQLPLEQQERILHAITTSVRTQAPAREKRSGIASRLRGIAKPKGRMPSDAELKDDYLRYLEDKYS